MKKLIFVNLILIVFISGLFSLLDLILQRPMEEAIEEVAADFGMSAGKVKTTLFRMRGKLRKHLESEGIYL